MFVQPTVRMWGMSRIYTARQPHLLSTLPRLHVAWLLEQKLIENVGQLPRRKRCHKTNPPFVPSSLRLPASLRQSSPIAIYAALPCVFILCNKMLLITLYYLYNAATNFAACLAEATTTTTSFYKSSRGTALIGFNRVWGKPRIIGKIDNK